MYFFHVFPQLQTTNQHLPLLKGTKQRKSELMQWQELFQLINYAVRDAGKSSAKQTK
jgi:hypothetical protein